MIREEFPYSDSWAGIKIAISSVTVSSQDSVRDLVTVNYKRTLYGHKTWEYVTKTETKIFVTVIDSKVTI